MRIGIDVDGVLTELERYLWDFGTKYLAEKNEPINIEHNEYNTLKMFGWDEDTDNLFWDDIYYNYCKDVLPKMFAGEVIKKLKQENNEIYIVTARCELAKGNIKKAKKILVRWLKYNKIKYDKLILTEGDKLKYCLENEINVMIEDCPYNIRQISKQIPTICMHANYNSKVRGKNIIRCHTWYEVYEKISGISNTKEA